MIATLTAAALFLAATPLSAAAPKNVILLIGDGAGPAHFTAAGTLRGEQFRIGTMPVVGLATTHCFERAVTDSAAAASALATGSKVRYEALSLDPETGAPLETVLERAEANGKSTGLVTTTAFWDATVAAFAAHAKHRHDAGVREQMMERGIEVIAGGGKGTFGKDGVAELDAFAAAHGYTALDTRAELDAASGDRLLAVFPLLPREVDVPEARLPDLAGWAIEQLDDDPDGFFLVIEHEGIDGASHQNLTADVRPSLISFDEAVGIALDFAARKGDTLVVVTGDHETGGLRLSETKTGRQRLEWSTIEHTATAVPVFAAGPGADVFGAFQDNTDIGKVLLGLMGPARASSVRPH